MWGIKVVKWSWIFIFVLRDIVIKIIGEVEYYCKVRFKECIELGVE